MTLGNLQAHLDVRRKIWKWKNNISGCIFCELKVSRNMLFFHFHTFGRVSKRARTCLSWRKHDILMFLFFYFRVWHGSIGTFCLLQLTGWSDQKITLQQTPKINGMYKTMVWQLNLRFLEKHSLRSFYSNSEFSSAPQN